MRAPILITGISKRLGFALAKHLLANDWPVIGTYRSPNASHQALSKLGATLYRCDFYQQSQIDELTAQVRQQHPRLRALVHNASDWQAESLDNTGTDAFDEALFTRMMQVHAAVPYQLNLAFRDLLTHDLPESAVAERDIIHVSDYVAQTGSAKHLAYAASKAALENLNLSFAKLLAPQIKVNCIAPALMLFNEHDSDSYKQKALGKALLPKEGGSDEFNDTVMSILNSSYVTGRVYHLDGGRHLK